MEHLIANSGIQFITQEVEFNPSESFTMPSSQKPMKYTFVDSITEDELDPNSVFTNFDILCPGPGGDGKYYLLRDLFACNDHPFVTLPSGLLYLDEAGMPVIRDDYDTQFLNALAEDELGDVYSMVKLDSFQVVTTQNRRERVSAFSVLLDKWIPMPMFTKEADGTTSTAPTSWCRLKISLIDKDKSGLCRFRLIWALDTNLADPDSLSEERPVFYDTDPAEKEFCLCNNAATISKFFYCGLNPAYPEPTNVTTYLSQLFGLEYKAGEPRQHRFIAFYIYLVNLIRVQSRLSVMLHHNVENKVPVDLVLDIGNSRTCGVLFESNDFASGKMLELRDLTRPWLKYDSSFDMRVVFRKADFGNDIITDDEDLFIWKSVVRVGEEAQHLIYTSRQDSNYAERTTNYSSPKRYLWDGKPFDGRWEFLISSDDPTNITAVDSIYVRGLTTYFDEAGNLTDQPMYGTESRYSRSSLNTFVFLEILQQAIMQINSAEFRQKSIRGCIDCRRYLRNIIITAPTAMPNCEQIKLRQCAQDAVKILQRSYPFLEPISVTPTPDSIKPRNDYDDDELNLASWSYDEATASQLVYLYAEIAKKYSTDVKSFIDAKGHIRPDLLEKGYDKKSITIGSIDIGAGTTDLMICAYEYEGEGNCHLKPVPLFWDSFYQAGDDLLRNIILREIIGGVKETPTNASTTVGTISSVLISRLLKLSDEQLSELRSVNKSDAYRSLMHRILTAPDAREREDAIRRYADNLVRGYFSVNQNAMSYLDTKCRLDFNTQVSLPLASKMLSLLNENSPSKIVTFDDIFTNNKPAESLLNHFEEHFGFRFEEIEWKFDADSISSQIKSTMEPLMKQLSIIIGSFDVDVLILAGRPSSLKALTDLFVKYYPLSPDRLIRLSDYQVGDWYPLANPDGYFRDQKSVVAVGAMVGFLASTTGFDGLSIDFRELIKTMKSTANYIGVYDTERLQIVNSFMTPTQGFATCMVSGSVTYIGCKQLNAQVYQARPLYALYNRSGKTSLTAQLVREFEEDRELITVEEVIDSEGTTISRDSVELVQQSIADSCFWLDDGVFKFL